MRKVRASNIINAFCYFAVCLSCQLSLFSSHGFLFSILNIAYHFPVVLNYINITGEYVQNQCNGTGPSCNCPKRLPSCIGKPDGNQEFPGKRGEPDYITCLKNRTMKITKCEVGKYFDPRSKICKQISGRMLTFNIFFLFNFTCI